MVTVPATMPVTRPDAGSIVAVVGSLLLHVPPAFGSLKVMVPLAAHTTPVPEMAPGVWFTVIVVYTGKPQVLE